MTTLFKMLALIFAMALTATSAFAVNEFEQQMTLTDDQTINISGVTAEGDGTVVIYDYRTGAFGDALGMTDVTEGANNNVQVTLDTPPLGDVAAVLYLGEVTTPAESAAWIEINIEGS